MVIVYDKKSIFEGVEFFSFFFTRTDPAGAVKAAKLLKDNNNITINMK